MFRRLSIKLVDGSLRALECRVAVADSGSITRAARLLHSSQPAVSHQLAALERETRMVLLRREPRGVKLTPAGRAAVAGARRAIEAAASAVRSARGRRSDRRIAAIGLCAEPQRVCARPGHSRRSPRPASPPRWRPVTQPAGRWRPSMPRDIRSAGWSTSTSRCGSSAKPGNPPPVHASDASSRSVSLRVKVFGFPSGEGLPYAG
jgi:hypothetical protein